MLAWDDFGKCCAAFAEADYKAGGGGSGESKGDTARPEAAAPENESARQSESGQLFRPWGVRYQVAEVDRSVAFYTQHLGFKLEQRAGEVFAAIANGSLKVLLSGPGSSGARLMPDGRRQEPGGWNRIVLRVDNLPERVEMLGRAGLHFRNQIETGPGGRQIQIEDPDGNPIELFEPARS